MTDYEVLDGGITTTKGASDVLTRRLVDSTPPWFTQSLIQALGGKVATHPTRPVAASLHAYASQEGSEGARERKPVDRMEWAAIAWKAAPHIPSRRDRSAGVVAHAHARRLMARERARMRGKRPRLLDSWR
ncbi:MAG: hypothetical protein V1724_02320 [Chloroflexota bacterium]